MAELKATCELCDVEPSILGATQTQIAIGVKCYGKLIDKNAHWSIETTRDELDEMVRKRKPMEIVVPQGDTR